MFFMPQNWQLPDENYIEKLSNVGRRLRLVGYLQSYKKHIEIQNVYTFHDGGSNEEVVPDDF